MDSQKKIAAAVKAAESQFPKPVPVEKKPFDMEAARMNPENNRDLWTLKVLHDSAAIARAQAGSTIVALRQALSTAEISKRFADDHLEKIREDIRAKYLQLGLETPPLFHERDCDCQACDPLRSA